VLGSGIGVAERVDTDRIVIDRAADVNHDAASPGSRMSSSPRGSEPGLPDRIVAPAGAGEPGRGTAGSGPAIEARGLARRLIWTTVTIWTTATIWPVASFS
jgi:hypothetical protein